MDAKQTDTIARKFLAAAEHYGNRKVIFKFDPTKQELTATNGAGRFISGAVYKVETEAAAKAIFDRAVLCKTAYRVTSISMHFVRPVSAATYYKRLGAAMARADKALFAKIDKMLGD